MRAFGSLAQEVMDTGVAGVVAMRYNVYVITAAQFVANLYASLVQGQTLGEAVTSGRKQLKDQPQREVAYKPVTLQDWVVPVVYEAAAIALFPPPTNTPTLTITLHENDALPTTGLLDAQLPKTPDVGFFGRDETLLAIDRAFDHHAIVLLHAFAGSGKTSTAAEFGRWYALTGGLLEAGKQGFVLFTSFQRYLPLPRVLDKLGQVFERDLAQSGIHWLALSDDQRRAVALQVLSQISVLWVWDNVEPVAGFPDGETQRWNEAEQQELVDFLRDARTTKAKFLLTSRRDERAWLGDLPVRVQVPPMPMQERVQFARALAKKHGYRLTDVGNWLPLLKYTQGNPLTITVVVGQALRNGYKSKEQIENFVADLRSGEAELDDDESEGRSKSLSASLSYGFANNFNEDECQQLALLYFFQGFVNAGTLCLMGFPEAEWCISTVRSITFEDCYKLLNQATEIGLLTKLTENYYSVHPTLPWYFKRLFDRYYSIDNNHLSLTTRAFTEAMGVLGSYGNNQYDENNRDVIAPLICEEANLLYARHLARKNNWWNALIRIVQGLRTLYEYTGRRIEWAKLVAEIKPSFVEPVTNSWLPEREEEWGIVTEYCVQLAREEQRWAEAEELNCARVKWARHRASSLLVSSSEKLSLNATRHQVIRTLAVVLHERGQIRREQRKPDCIESYDEAFGLLEQIGDQAGAAVYALNVGHAYTQIPAIRNLIKAEQWYQRSLQLRPQNDFLGCSKCLTELGRTAHERFQEARSSGCSEAELHHYLNQSIQFFSQGLNLLPQNAIAALAIAHNQLGNVCRSAGDFDRACLNYREAIRYQEAQGDLYDAANTRFNIALSRAQARRFDEALLYAQAAISNYETFGDRAVSDVQDAQKLISLIEDLQKS